MKFKSTLTGDIVGLEQIKDWYNLELVEDTVVRDTPVEDLNRWADRLGIQQPTEENNGGKTNYYDLPTISDSELISLLANKVRDITPVECRLSTDAIRELLPTTLNDLIEYKDMYPFQHEIFKACYALQERADKDIKGGSILRELNKIKYYAERGITLAKAGKIW